jgi:hypothetical protein
MHNENRERTAPLLVLLIIITLFFVPAQAAVYPYDSSLSVSIRFDNGQPTIQESLVRIATGKTLAGEAHEIEPAPAGWERDEINRITVTKDGNTFEKTIQTPTTSNIYVRSSGEKNTDILQTSDGTQKPYIELYYGYEIDEFTPWRYYLRVNQPGDTYAVISDFQTKIVSRRPITQVQKDSLYAGNIPAWGAI